MEKPILKIGLLKKRTILWKLPTSSNNDAFQKKKKKRFFLLSLECIKYLIILWNLRDSIRVQNLYFLFLSLSKVDISNFHEKKIFLQLSLEFRCSTRFQSSHAFRSDTKTRSIPFIFPPSGLYVGSIYSFCVVFAKWQFPGESATY